MHMACSTLWHASSMSQEALLDERPAFARASATYLPLLSHGLALFVYCPVGIDRVLILTSRLYGAQRANTERCTGAGCGGQGYAAADCKLHAGPDFQRGRHPYGGISWRTAALQPPRLTAEPWHQPHRDAPQVCFVPLLPSLSGHEVEVSFYPIACASCEGSAFPESATGRLVYLSCMYHPACNKLCFASVSIAANCALRLLLKPIHIWQFFCFQDKRVLREKQGCCKGDSLGVFVHTCLILAGANLCSATPASSRGHSPTRHVTEALRGEQAQRRTEETPPTAEQLHPSAPAQDGASGVKSTRFRQVPH